MNYRELIAKKHKLGIKKIYESIKVIELLDCEGNFSGWTKDKFDSIIVTLDKGQPIVLTNPKYSQDIEMIINEVEKRLKDV